MKKQHTAHRHGGPGTKMMQVLPNKLRPTMGTTLVCGRCHETFTGSSKLAGASCRLTRGCKGRLRLAK